MRRMATGYCDCMMMMRRMIVRGLLLHLVAAVIRPGVAHAAFPAPAEIPRSTLPYPGGFAAQDRQPFELGLGELERKLKKLRADAMASHDMAELDLFADAGVQQRGIVWALRYETNFAGNDIQLLKKSLRRAEARVEDVLAGRAGWTTRKGHVLRGYVSAVDGSTQPYGVVVPAGYDAGKPIRLDVVLHGSTRPVGLSELRFGDRFDRDDAAAQSGATGEFIELHPLGRVENGYRWAGETDVFEAIEAACRNYRIDRKRIVLRGMSMGASGAWHLGLKHPGFFVAIGPYCGYVDTHRFSETPLPNFVRVGELPPWQERTLHMLDSVDYAANAGVVPAIAAIGDKDVFFQAHVIMGAAMAREGLQMVNILSPGTGHVLDPPTHLEQMRRIGEYAARGLDPVPQHLRFVTWTLKYNRCHWIEVLRLNTHYERSEISADVHVDGSLEIAKPGNIKRFAIYPPVLPGPGAKVRIGGSDVALPKPHTAGPPQPLVFDERGGKWRLLDSRADPASQGKRPGVQGPIDDAFTGPFLCVRGTGRPWNPEIGAWADACLRRFAYEWARYMRGDLPVKDDVDVTDADVRSKNLILFGDPGSNLWIRRALPKLPLSWSRTQVQIGGRKYPADLHAPALVCANPLPGAADRYLVINSGHTFHEAEFSTLNYLLFPRLGDWAIMKISPGAKAWLPSAGTFPEVAVSTGLFDENWGNPVNSGR
jgi:hypothetical protein